MSDTLNNEQPPDHDQPPRSKVRLAFTIALWLVIILLLIAIFSPVRDVVISHFLTTAPTATPTIVPGGNQFYINAYPQGTVTIDGHEITEFPDPNNGVPPLTLSRGQHKIVWQAPPFQTLTCIVSVPPRIGEPCNYESTGNYTNDSSARVISFTASIENLSDTQQAGLKYAIQQTLNSLQSSDTLQVGEQYVYAQSSGTTVRTATQPLHATLKLNLDANPNSHNSCTPNGDFCTLSGQNCLQICSNGGTTSPGGTFTWNIVVLYYSTWTYTTQGGQVVAQNQPDTNSSLVGTDHSIELEAAWNGSAWHVSLPPHSFEPITPLSSTPPACASLHSLVGASTNYGTGASAFTATQNSSHTPVTWAYASGSSQAQGCLGLVYAASGTTSSQQLPAYFLYRFGVLLAANALAHSEFPSVPLADAYEQSIAQQIAAHYKM